jgi:RNA polymerase sigma-70 factor (ECF subfamily)
LTKPILPSLNEELYDALAKLLDKERTSVLLFYMENYSIKEIADIADILNSSQDAVKQQLSRGRNHLRGMLASNKAYQLWKMIN